MNKDHRPNKKAKGSKQAFIFGPFIGDQYWEAYRFAPYAISLKKRFPKHVLIVFTRPEHFDLYGNYADIFVPLKIAEGMYVPDKFKLIAYSKKEYSILCKYIRGSYERHFEIVDHYFPRIDKFMWKVRWQFPRKYMDYDFQPRSRNLKIVEELYGDVENLVLTTESNVLLENYNVVTIHDFSIQIQKHMKPSTSWLGCFIELMKKCDFVISNFERRLGKYSLLLNKPVVGVNETLTDDAIYLLNPHNTKVFKCNHYKEGVKEYEDNIRS